MTYRDDLQAARMRRDALARELREVRSRMDEFDGLAQQAEALERELAQCSRDLDQARAKVELPMLSRVRVASPCKERWSDMTGNDHVRFCGGCAKNVYDLSSLTADQAEALLREAGESLSVRFLRRSDGTILTSDCPVGARRKSVWRHVAGMAVAGGLAVSGIALSGAIIDTREMGQMQSSMMEEQPEKVEKVEDGYMMGTSEVLNMMVGTSCIGPSGYREGWFVQDSQRIKEIEAAEARLAARTGGLEHLNIRELRQQIADAQNRLDAATTVEERRSAWQELHVLRVQARENSEQLRQLVLQSP